MGSFNFEEGNYMNSLISAGQSSKFSGERNLEITAKLRIDFLVRLNKNCIILNFFNSRDKIYEYSLTNNDQFWSTLAESRLNWNQSFDQVNTSSFEDGRIEWFKGGKINVADNCVSRHLATRGDQPALIWEKDEENQTEILTFAELDTLVSKFSNVLKSHGVKKGDRVAIYYPVSPIGVAAMLACAKIGAIHSVVFAGFSAEALRQRINDADCQVVICADGTFRGGRYIPLKSVVDQAVEGCPGVKHVLVGTRNPQVNKMTTPLDVNLNLELENASGECESEIMDAEDPLFLLYTSGSTGKPKGLIHTQAGYLLYANVTTSEVFETKPGDVFGCVADIGWITGHTYVVYGPLSNGATSLLFESLPTYPNAGRYWSTVQKHKLTQFYGAPTAYRTLLRHGEDVPLEYDTSSLKTIGTVGEPINTEAWNWLHDFVGKGKAKVVDTWWQTETGGNMITPMPTEQDPSQFKPGSAQRPFYGIEPVLMSAEGTLVEGNDVNGALCIKRPWPGISRTIYGDHQRFLDTYINVYNGMYFTGDGAHRDDDGDYTITGRMDDVINISGHRLGTAEIEDCLTGLDSIAEAAVVGIPDEIKGETSFAFVIPTVDDINEDEIRPQLNQHIATQIAKFAVPKETIFVPGLPKTRSGKIMRRILRKIAVNDLGELGDISTLAEPEVVQQIIEKRNQSS